MSKKQRIPVFINPMKLFDWEDDPAPTPKEPTPGELLRFLCALGLPSDMGAFQSRYRDVSAKDQDLFFSIEDSGLVENLSVAFAYRYGTMNCGLAAGWSTRASGLCLVAGLAAC